MRPLCQICGVNLLNKTGIRKNGSQGYSRTCTSCRKKKWRRQLKEKCEFCGLVPVHKCQLDIDHKDGNHKNNKANNLQTLCANCHRLKTHLNRDWLNK